MRVFNFLVPFCFATMLFSCKQKKEQANDLVEVRDVVVTSVDHEYPPPPPPPPPAAPSRFKSIESWLNSICKKEKPPTPGMKFNFGVSENGARTIIYLYGAGESLRDSGVIKHTSFYPEGMYYMLPKEKSITSKVKVLEKITQELRLFIESDKFQQCFLKNAKVITTDWAGVIWSN